MLESDSGLGSNEKKLGRSVVIEIYDLHFYEFAVINFNIRTEDIFSEDLPQINRFKSHRIPPNLIENILNTFCFQIDPDAEEYFYDEDKSDASDTFAFLCKYRSGNILCEAFIDSMDSDEVTFYTYDYQSNTYQVLDAVPDQVLERVVFDLLGIADAYSENKSLIVDHVVNRE